MYISKALVSTTTVNKKKFLKKRMHIGKSTIRRVGLSTRPGMHGINKTKNETKKEKLHNNHNIMQ